MVLVGLYQHPTKDPPNTDGKPDALVFRLEAVKKQSLEKVASALSGEAWGVWANSLDGEQAAWLKEKGCDFVVVPAQGTPLDALKDEMGRFLYVAGTLDDELGRTIEDMPVDGVVMESVEETPISLKTLMLISSVRGFTGKPVLLARSSPVTSWEIQCLWDIGIDGLVIDVEKATPEALGATRKKMGELARRRPRPDRSSALIPNVAPLAARPPHRHEEEEEEEEEE